MPGNNACLGCDERNCGPAFKSCSGANRRRLGIKSDIVRSDGEICDVDISIHEEWLQDHGIHPTRHSRREL